MKVRKDYLKENLTKEEKLYLKRIVMTAKNKYVKRNYNNINNYNIDIDEINVIVEDSIIDEILKNCENNIEFVYSFSNLKLINIIEALTLKERKVLFYLHKQNRTLNQISEIMNYNPRTIRRIRDKAYKTIAKKLIDGGYKNV